MLCVAVVPQVDIWFGLVGLVWFGFVNVLAQCVWVPSLYKICPVIVPGLRFTTSRNQYQSIVAVDDSVCSTSYYSSSSSSIEILGDRLV